MRLDRKSNLSLYYQNVDGFRSKLKGIQIAFSTCTHEVVILTETKMIPGICDAELGVNEFNIFITDRSFGTNIKDSGDSLLIGVTICLIFF